MNVEDPHFNPGGIKDRPDNRDFQWNATAPSPFDWNTGYDIEQIVGTLPVKDQNGSYSCGGQAWASYAAALEAAHDGTIEERSAKFIYAQTYQANGGSAGRDNANIFVKQGAARETVLPSYDNGRPPTEAFMQRSRDITASIRTDALSNRSYSYANVSADIDTVAQAIRDNHGVVLGIDGQNNGTWTTPFPKPPTQVEWRHWIYAGRAKLINGVKHVGILNSWGAAIGEQGWQWLSEAYFLNTVSGDASVWSVWTHVLQTQFQFTKDFGFLSSGEDVRQLQMRLGVSPTGLFWTATRKAVRTYQTMHNIPSTGYVGPLTRAALNRYV